LVGEGFVEEVLVAAEEDAAVVGLRASMGGLVEREGCSTYDVEQLMAIGGDAVRQFDAIKSLTEPSELG
jgi:hypothetical protein